LCARTQAGWSGGADVGAFGAGGAFQTLDWLVEATDSLLRESGGAFQNLDELAKSIDGSVLGRDPTGAGCLQYKIYPWGRPGVGDERDPFDVFLLAVPDTDRANAVPEARSHTVFNIWGPPGDLHADEIAGDGGIEVHGRTPEELVNRVASVRGHRPDAFTWIRDIRSMHAD
jgi:hypothetical protein